MSHGQNMLLVTSYWGEGKTFRMMPLSGECPYTEVIYDPNTTLLAVIGKVRKDTLKFTPKLDENGDPVMVKGKPRGEGKPAYQEKRLQFPVLQEYFIVEKEEQIAFLKMFAVNFDSFDYTKYLRDIGAEAESIIHNEDKPLVNKDGQPLKVEA